MEGSDEGDFLSDGGDFRDEIELNTAASRYSATGNEADIEDNVLPPSTPTSAMLSEKLRLKPPGCFPITPCTRMASAREEFMKNITLRPPSTTERLTVRPKSGLETITDTIERPEGALPPLALPSWHNLPLDNKIPGIRSPVGLLYFSPGKLSSQLRRKTKGYNLTDPHNRERVVRSPYTALNDPNAKGFINRPQIKQLLYNQGLINENNEVIYTLREFNGFRDYLRTVYCDDVHESVHGADELWKMEKAQLRSIQSYLNQTDGKETELRRKLNRARKFAKGISRYEISRYNYKQRQTEARLIAFAREKEQINAEKIVRSIEKSRLHQEKLKLLLEERERFAAQTYHHSVMKNLHCMERRNQGAMLMKKAHEDHLREWMESKINQSGERLERYNRVDISCRENLKRNAARRQGKMEMHRRNLAIAIKEKQAKQVRQWEITRKYFYIWLNKTRQRVAKSFKDSAHESCWINGAAGTLDETVKYLRIQTNTHERLDDFIFSIMRLKNDIKRQLELEEAEEAQAALEEKEIEGQKDEEMQHE